MKRLQTLDAFRGLAVLAVILYHYTSRYRGLYGHDFDAKYDFKFGHLGVELFFIISGFVIFLTVNRSAGAGDFLVKRFSRLFPTFWCCLLITFFIISVFGLKDREVTFAQLAGNFTMIPAYLGFKEVDGAYWSLTHEIFFYLLMAVCIASKQVNNIIYIGIGWIVLTIIHITVFKFPPHVAIALNLKEAYGMLFFSGILFYKLKEADDKSLKANLKIYVLLIICCLIVCYDKHKIGNAGVIAIFYAMFYLFSVEKLNWLTWKPLVFLGSISYPLYLIHQNIGYVAITALRPSLGSYPAIMILLVILILGFAAFLIHQFVEKPSITVLRRLIDGGAHEKKVEAPAKSL